MKKIKTIKVIKSEGLITILQFYAKDDIEIGVRYEGGFVIISISSGNDGLMEENVYSSSSIEEMIILY